MSSRIVFLAVLAWLVSGGDDFAHLDLPGLHNVLRVTDRLYCGNSPEDDVGFASLRKLGIRTIITVDGARPDVASAKKFGMRYVHLPIGYDQVTQEQALRLARAVRDLPGPIYLHCHHGKHRAPAAAAAVLRCLDASCSVARAVALMKQAGTGANYRGLYDSPGKLRRPTKDELDRVPADFPAVADVGGLVKCMADIDLRWDHLKLARKVGWKTPPDHPDLDPPHEALQLGESFREAGRLKTTRGDVFRRWLAEAEANAGALEKELRRGKGLDARAAEALFQRGATACTRCHTKYRDVPGD
jgi:protein tyrosine phosphatase (PTP) superfamily phosphohydrolase (DUF442 family)